MDPVFGGFGENFTIDELEENLVCIGDVYRVGEAQLQVSQPRRPCWNLSQRWQVRDLALHVQNSGKTGWYFRVLMEGCVQSGASFELIKRPNPKWTIAIVNEIMYHREQDREVAEDLSSCTLLSPGWRTALSQRAKDGTIQDAGKRLDEPSSA